MKEIFLGEFIRKRRLESGLTQEQLCEGICEPMTVSRLENGKQTPSRNKINAMLQRLGVMDTGYYALLSKNEIEISKLEKEITALNVQFERVSKEEKIHVRQAALEKHRQLEAILDKDDTISRQLILRSRVLLGGEDGAMTLEEKLETLLSAIRLTSPHFDQEEIGRGLYTDAEIKIINQIAGIYSDLGNHHQAIDMLKQLLCYIHNHLKSVPADRAHIPMVTYNYARELEIVGRYEEALATAEEGKEVCRRYGYYLFLPDFLAVLAECCYHLKDFSKSADWYTQSYYAYKIIGDCQNQSIIQAEAKEFLDLDLN